MPRGGKGGIHTDTGIFSKQIDEFDDWLGLASSDTSLTSRKEIKNALFSFLHGLRTPREEISFTARPKIQSQSQIFRYGGSIFCLPHWPKFSDIFDLCLHWVSVVRDYEQAQCVELNIRFCLQSKFWIIYGISTTKSPIGFARKHIRNMIEFENISLFFANLAKPHNIKWGTKHFPSKNWTNIIN